MPSLKDLRVRIASVQSTKKITSAMKMVAASKLRRAQEAAEAARPYAERMERMLSNLAGSISAGGPPMLAGTGKQDTHLLVVCTSDRGLAGAFNAQILRRTFALERELRAEGAEVTWLVSGRRGRSTLRFRGYEIAQAWTGHSERPEYADAQAIARKAIELYANEEVDRVVVIYNEFRSALNQEVAARDLLPLPEQIVEGGEDETEEAAQRGDFIYEPEPEQILERLLPVYVETELYRALLESAASEQGARMTAMRNASSNAGDLISNLTLAMNRARQAEITQEILEVVAGADALTG
jgi:F-type H+-transporting ATPase subunit gamma